MGVGAILELFELDLFLLDLHKHQADEDINELGLFRLFPTPADDDVVDIEQAYSQFQGVGGVVGGGEGDFVDFGVREYLLVNLEFLLFEGYTCIGDHFLQLEFDGICALLVLERRFALHLSPTFFEFHPGDSNFLCDFLLTTARLFIRGGGPKLLHLDFQQFLLSIHFHSDVLVMLLIEFRLLFLITQLANIVILVTHLHVLDLLSHHRDGI